MIGRIFLVWGVIFVLGGCIPNAAVSGAAGLRSRDGICSHVLLSALSGITMTACMRNGSPKTLHDDPSSSLLLIETTGNGLEIARPGGYQVTVLHDGVKVFQEILPDSIPDVPGAGGGSWHGYAVLVMPFSWTAGLWEFRYVATYNTDLAGRSTATVREAQAGPALRTDARSKETTFAPKPDLARKIPLPAWASEPRYADCVSRYLRPQNEVPERAENCRRTVDLAAGHPVDAKP